MQLPTDLLFLTAFAASTASAWRLALTMQDFRTASMHGTTNSGCTRLGFDMSSPVAVAYFCKSSFADTFELYANGDCTGRKYTNGEGAHRIAPGFRVRAYKVY